jgi:hypothetical protein
MSSEPRILLFDLGGVLADLGDPVTTIGLDLEPDEFWAIWLGSENHDSIQCAGFITAVARGRLDI